MTGCIGHQLSTPPEHVCTDLCVVDPSDDQAVCDVCGDGGPLHDHPEEFELRCECCGERFSACECLGPKCDCGDTGLLAYKPADDGSRWIEACDDCNRFQYDDEAATAFVRIHGGCWSWEYGKYGPESVWQHPLWIPGVKP